jgi:hypothetical protein
VILGPGARKFALTAHVTSSVGWLGAVAAFLVLSLAGLTSDRGTTVRAAYVAMELIGLYMIVPLGLAALLTGLLQAFGTRWGLVRYYWVLTKFCLTVVATVLLLMHQFTAVAGAARRVSSASVGVFPDAGGLATQLVFDAGAAILLLMVTTTLSVYKPWGLTAYGRRLEERAAQPSNARTPRRAMPVGLKVSLAVAGTIVATILAIHLAGGGMGRH